MSESDNFVVGLVQNPCAVDPCNNISLAEKGVREAANRGAQIVCLQELFASRYFCIGHSSEAFALAEEIPGPLTQRFQSLAAELSLVLIVPVFEKAAPGVYFNSAAIIDADGALLGVYRKMHIPEDPCFHEKYYFTPGDPGQSFPVFKTAYARLSVLICWDQWYPEAARIAALGGAEILFYPTAIGRLLSESPEVGGEQRDAWTIMQRSHAIANGVYVASVNRSGVELRERDAKDDEGIEFFGASFIADPFGRFAAAAQGEESKVLVTVCKRSEIETTRQTWPFLRDRRIDAYKDVLSRFLANVKNMR